MGQKGVEAVMSLFKMPAPLADLGFALEIVVIRGGNLH